LHATWSRIGYRPPRNDEQKAGHAPVILYLILEQKQTYERRCRHLAIWFLVIPERTSVKLEGQYLTL
jgi:hypothetical protein